MMNLSRRRFLTVSASTLFAASNVASAFAKASNKPGAELYASSYMDKSKSFGIALLTKSGEIQATYPLPARGHGIAFDAVTGWLVVFARRSGRFALAINLHQPTISEPVQTPLHTHFYGHGVFSQDGKKLFATENKFADGVGIIGVYDTTDNFKRIAEYSSGGLGPHDMLLMPDGNTLCVANGGIVTHPETGRAKLNLSEMQSCVSFIDSRKGEIQKTLQVPKALQKLSLRHLTIDANNTVWLGGQYQGRSTISTPLVAKIEPGRGLDFPDYQLPQVQSMSGYIGSIACSDDGNGVAFSSPKGNQLITISNTGRVIKEEIIEEVCGLAASTNGFCYSSLNGKWQGKQHEVYWDNHIIRLEKYTF